MNISQYMQSFLDDHRKYHSSFQIDHFIIGKSGGTDYGMYRQAVREIVRRYRTLRSLKVQLDKRTYIPEKVHYTFEQDEQDIEHESLESSFRDTLREFARFFKIAESLKDRLGEITEEKRSALEAEYFYHCLKTEAALDIATTGRVGKGTYRNVCSLPTQMRERLLKEIKNPGTLLHWYENFEPDLPIVQVLPEDLDDAKLLLRDGTYTRQLS